MPPKFNPYSDGPENCVKTTATHIGEFTITVSVCLKGNFVHKLRNPARVGTISPHLLFYGYYVALFTVVVTFSGFQTLLLICHNLNTIYSVMYYLSSLCGLFKH